MQSTLAVTGAADFLSTVDITGAVQMDSSLALAGNADFNGNLDVSGSSDLHGAVKAYGTLEVDGEATLASAIVEDLTNGRVALVGAAGALIDDAQITHSAGQLTVSGSTFSKDVSIVRDLAVGRDMSAVSGSFSGDLTIAGDLVVNGTTVTVNTTELLVEDNMVVINKNETGAGVTAGTAGIEIERGSADNAIVQWLESADKFELKVGTAYADLKIDDLEAVDGTFSGDISAVHASLTGDLTAVSGSFSGDVDVAGDLTVGSIKIDGDTATRLYIVDADGSMKDEAKLRFDGSELLVDAHLEVSGAADLKSTLAVASDADLNGNLDVALASDLRGAVHAYSTLLLDGAADLKSILWVSGAAEFLSTMDIVGAVQMDSTLSVDGQATFSAAINLDQAADQSILKTGGDLYMSASADLRLQAGGDVKLADQYRAASTWSDAEGIKLAASAAEWSNFKATFGGEVSLLAALTGGGSGGKFKAEIAATSAFVTSSAMADVAGGADFASKWASIVEPKIAKVDVFVNGQLMVSGSGMDYNVASNGDITFGFDLVADDIVMALVR
jgi:cytoskeletal protein CcmA (bactofilin family)